MKMNPKKRTGIMKDADEELLKILGAKGSKRILELLCEHETVQYYQMRTFVNTHTLNRRLHELLDLGLMEHYLEKGETRKQWYEITEKGRIVLQELRDIVHIMRS